MHIVYCGTWIIYCVTKKLLGVCFVGVVMGAYLLPHLYTHIDIDIDVCITSYRHVIVTWEKVHKTLLYCVRSQQRGTMSGPIHRKRSRTKGTKKEIVVGSFV